jgi:hypothetical protein
MNFRLKAAPMAGALASALFVAACSDRSAGPVAPTASSATNAPAAFSSSVAQQELLAHAIIHPTVEAMERERASHRPSRSSNLTYHGGIGGIGVETAPRVYLVFWGSQWSSDPSNEAAIVQDFLNGAGGSAWLNSVTQYCQSVSTGTVFCNSAGAPAGNPSRILVAVWFDNANAAASRPSQSNLAAEAVAAAAHFGNTTAASNVNAQYVIATSHGNNSSGFGSQYCAYHSSTSSSAGNVAYTNLPYITDGGASCGANFNGLGPNAGISIVEGHEMAESITDQFPSGGWLDGSGAENGDKCAWIASGQGATSTITISTGTFPVQSLWSNTFNGGAGGCVLSF